MNTPVLRRLRWFMLPLLIGLLPAAEPEDPIQTVERAASEWVKVRAETTRIETHAKLAVHHEPPSSFAVV